MALFGGFHSRPWLVPSLSLAMLWSLSIGSRLPIDVADQRGVGATSHRSGQAGVVSEGQPSDTVTGDFEIRCQDPAVIRCYGFDDLNDLERGDPHNWGHGSSRMLPGPTDLCSQNQCYALDMKVKASGTSSLRFEIPSNSPADTSGSFKLNFRDDYSQQIGEGESVYVQFRYRVSPEMLLPFPGGGGFKLIIIGEGDQASNPTEVWSCTELESVITTNNRYMGPTFYHSCGRFVNLEFWDGTQVRLQHQGPPYCYYPNDPKGACWSYAANEWMTFQVGIDVGTWNTPSSRVRVWAAHENEPSVLIYDSNVSDPNGFTLYNNPGSGSGTYPGAKFGKIWLLPYNTGKGTSASHDIGFVWYDDLIVSRAQIPDPTPRTER